jgi:REP element-mobilizing transposase RayT
MLHGFHVIISTYGFWLPNDPRGSWSEFVRSWELLQFGKATKVTTRHSVAAAKHNVEERLVAKKALSYPEVSLSGVQALAVANGFRAAVEEGKYQVYACSILPQHVHLVFAPHERDIRRIIGHLKARATQRLAADGLHPLDRYRQKAGAAPSPWGRKGWVVFLYSERHLIQAINYVADNPLKEGKRQQSWSFVQSYPKSS